MESEITGIKNSLISAKGMGRTRKCMDKELFKASVQQAIEKTKRSIDSFMKDNLSDSDTFKTLQTKLEAYEKIAAEPIDTDTQFETASWLFNGGLLREDWEIDKKIKEAETLEMRDKAMEAYKADKGFSFLKTLAMFMWLIVPLQAAVAIGIIISGGAFSVCGSFLDSIEMIFGNIFVALCLMCYFFPVLIILVIAGAIIGIVMLDELDKEKGIKHDTSEDNEVIAAASACAIATFIGCKNSRKNQTHREV